jgi:tetratricopeptide (TPR) repeat protein
VTSRLVLLVAAVTVGCTAAGSEESSLLRGDEAFARGDLPEALAEYRLALRQGNRSAPVLTRVAHAYTATGRISEAVEHYREAVAIDAEVADLAAADLLRFARSAIEGRDQLAASQAVAAAAALKPGVSMDGIALPLARYLVRTGEHGRALSFFERAVRETGSDPQVVYEMALAHDGAGSCGSALRLFDAAWGRLSVAQRADADWRTGNCSMRLAEQARADGDLAEALAHYETTILLGEPRGRIPEAWFQTGEILVATGECAAALRAFEQVELAEPAPNLRERARDRIETLRFDPGSLGPC